MTTDTERLEFVQTHTAHPTLHADDVHVRWVMPETFHDLPIHAANDDETVSLLGELVDNALPGAEEEDKARLGVVCALAVADLQSTGVDYASICVTAVEGVPCTATVLVSLIDSPEVEGAARGAARAIAAGLRRAGTGEISEIELPCGFAVSDIGVRDAKLTGDLTETGESLSFSAWYIRVYVPLPNSITFFMEMETPTTAGWDVFSTMFGNTASSIRLFKADGTPLITSVTAA